MFTLLPPREHDSSDILRINSRCIYDYSRYIKLFLGDFLADVRYREDNGKVVLEWLIPDGAEALAGIVPEDAERQFAERLSKAEEEIKWAEDPKSGQSPLRRLCAQDILKKVKFPPKEQWLVTTAGRLTIIDWGLNSNPFSIRELRVRLQGSPPRLLPKQVTIPEVSKLKTAIVTTAPKAGVLTRSTALNLRAKLAIIGAAVAVAALLFAAGSYFRPFFGRQDIVESMFFVNVPNKLIGLTDLKDFPANKYELKPIAGPIQIHVFEAPDQATVFSFIQNEIYGRQYKRRTQDEVIKEVQAAKGKADEARKDAQQNKTNDISWLYYCSKGYFGKYPSGESYYNLGDKYLNEVGQKFDNSKLGEAKSKFQRAKQYFEEAAGYKENAQKSKISAEKAEIDARRATEYKEPNAEYISGTEAMAKAQDSYNAGEWKDAGASFKLAEDNFSKAKELSPILPDGMTKVDDVTEEHAGKRYYTKLKTLNAGIEMIFIPATPPFYIGTSEVTHEQHMAIVGKKEGDGNNGSAIPLSDTDAGNFCMKIRPSGKFHHANDTEKAAGISAKRIKELAETTQATVVTDRKTFRIARLLD